MSLMSWQCVHPSMSVINFRAGPKKFSVRFFYFMFAKLIN